MYTNENSDVTTNRFGLFAFAGGAKVASVNKLAVSHYGGQREQNGFKSSKLGKLQTPGEIGELHQTERLGPSKRAQRKQPVASALWSFNKKLVSNLVEQFWINLANIKLFIITVLVKLDVKRRPE